MGSSAPTNRMYAPASRYPNTSVPSVHAAAIATAWLNATLASSWSLRPTACDTSATVATTAPAAASRYDRSIVEGPLRAAVWKIAWPTMVTNVIGGLQGIVDQVLVGNLIGYQGNAAIGVSWQILLVVIVFLSSLFTGMGVLVARFAGANDHDKVNRVVYQAFLTAVVLGVCVLGPIGWVASPSLLRLVHASPEVSADALIRSTMCSSIPGKARRNPSMMRRSISALCACQSVISSSRSGVSFCTIRIWRVGLCSRQIFLRPILYSKSVRVWARSPNLCWTRGPGFWQSKRIGGLLIFFAIDSPIVLCS